MSDGPNMMNSHFPTDDNPRFIRPDVEFRQAKPGGPSQLHLDGELVSIVVGKVDMDAKPPRPGV